MSLAYNDNPSVIGDYVWITCDDTRGRRSRAAHISHERRRYAEVHGVTLELLAKSYDEAPGFLHRSSFRYRIIRPAPACQVCGTPLDPSDEGGYVHLLDNHEDHVPVLPATMNAGE